MGMDTCCFCFDLKDGTVAVGAFTVITRLLGIAVFATLLGLAHKHEVNPSETEFADIMFGIAIGECFLSAIFGAMLIVGVHKNIRGLFIPWMVMSIITIGSSVYSFFGSMVYITYGGVYIGKAFGSLVAVSLMSYMFWCVCTYYKSLSGQNIPYQDFKNDSSHNQNLQNEMKGSNKIAV